jgi:hypothetical protein
MQASEVAFAALFVLWWGLAIGSWVFFFRNRDARLKRRVFRILLPLTGVLFVAFSLAVTGLRWEALLFLAPPTVLILWLNYRMTKFCSACGATLINHNWFTPMRYCQQCGAPLDE